MYIIIYIYIFVCVCVCVYVHYIAKRIGSPPSNEMFDYFSNLHEYTS